MMMNQTNIDDGEDEKDLEGSRRDGEKEKFV